MITVGLVACEPNLTEPTTDANTFRQTDDLPPSATFLPFIPTDSESSFIGRSDPTNAALAAEGQPSVEFEENPIAVPTAVSLPIQSFSTDGHLLQMEYYTTPLDIAPLIILLHDANQTHAALDALAITLQNNGYNVLVPDQRGHGNSGGEVDWPRSVGDMEIFLNTVQNFPAINHTAVIFIGLGEGANVALVSCSRTSTCRGAGVISPRLSSNTEMDLIRFLGNGGQSWLFVTADDDGNATQEMERLNGVASGDYLWQRYGNGGRGLQLFSNRPDLERILVEWLRSRLPVG